MSLLFFVLAGCAADGAAPRAPCGPAAGTASAALVQTLRALPGGSLVAPEQVAVDGNTVLVADRGRGELRRVDRALQNAATFARLPGRIAGLHVDRAHSVYAVLPAQRIVRQFAADGRIERDYRDSDGLAVPVDVAADGTGPVYVADSANARVLVFNRLGQVSGSLGERIGQRGPFLSVTALAQAEGRLYVLDATAHRVLAFGESGEATVRELGNAVPHPVALAADRWQRVIVGDASGRLWLLEADPARAPVALEGVSRIAQLADLWLDDIGLLYAADLAGGSVHILQVSLPCQ